MGELKELKKALRNPKDTYLSWALIIRRGYGISDPRMISDSQGMAEHQHQLLDFRRFEPMMQTWKEYEAAAEVPEDLSIGLQVRALSRYDGSVVAAVAISDKDKADVVDAELSTQGYVHERVAHLLKTDPEPFQAMRRDMKRFELRKDDRPMGYGIDDELRLAHWDPEVGRYRGDIIVARVTYIARNEEWGLKPGHVVMGLVLQEYLPRHHPKAQLWLGDNQMGVN